MLFLYQKTISARVFLSFTSTNHSIFILRVEIYMNFYLQGRIKAEAITQRHIFCCKKTNPKIPENLLLTFNVQFILFNFFVLPIFTHFYHFYFAKWLKYIFILTILNIFSIVKCHSATINCRLATVKYHSKFLLSHKHVTLEVCLDCHFEMTILKWLFWK